MEGNVAVTLTARELDVLLIGLEEILGGHTGDRLFPELASLWHKLFDAQREQEKQEGE